MQDDFISYYNKELVFLRHLGAEFSMKHPHVAANLRIDGKNSTDPHVSRLIESFAFLSARVHRKLDDDLTELADAILSVLYPHYILPIPSCSIIQIQPNSKLAAPSFLEKGSVLVGHTASAQACKFTTTYDINLLPITVDHLEFGRNMEFTSELANLYSQTKGILRLKLKSTHKDFNFSKLTNASLRFFINMVVPYSYKFYELIFKNLIGAVLYTASDDKTPHILDKECLKPVGFAEEEPLLPFPKHSFVGYRFLTEFFVYPEKFLFFDIIFENLSLFKTTDKEIEIFLLFDTFSDDLNLSLNAKSLALGCTPIVNLFKQEAEPIDLTHQQSEYPIIPDARHLEEMEVYTVNNVKLFSPGEKAKSCQFIYGPKFYQENEDNSVFWSISRLFPDEILGADENSKSEVNISFVDLNFSPTSSANSIAQLSLWCTNHNLPTNLTYGENGQNLQLLDEGLEGNIKCLFPFTPSYHLKKGKGYRWQLVSHLTLNNFSITEDSICKELLQEILSLYNFNDSKDIDLLISSIVSASAQPAIYRFEDHFGNSVCRGTKITITMKEETSRNFLFSSILERFLAVYCAMNSFTQLVVNNEQGEWKKWNPRAGLKPLV
ncbi:MAG: type VI secretion system baseplate subunit TssF [Alphaproteobacteria bacterium]|nr:type VI secretion system baseplate subunit TssF [Alphaproteobacteria bacterium]